MDQPVIKRLYDRYVLPTLINCGCGTKDVDAQRAKVVPQARGRVLEVGFGTGLNLPHYEASQVELLFALEPSLGMRLKASGRVENSVLDVRWLDLPGEEIPLEDGSVDTVLLTYTLCTIPDAERALAQMRRVLRPGGRLLWVEHGLAPEASVRRWQRRIEPLWKRIAGGCHLTRSTERLLEQNGFRTQTDGRTYLKGPRWASFNTWGSASVA